MPLMYFKLIFCESYKIGVQFHCFLYEYELFPPQFIKETFRKQLLSCLYTNNKIFFKSKEIISFTIALKKHNNLLRNNHNQRGQRALQ